VHVAG
jgi:hypothetical protein